jgi:tmRNA-binding protein
VVHAVTVQGITTQVELTSKSILSLTGSFTGHELTVFIQDKYKEEWTVGKGKKMNSERQNQEEEARNKMKQRKIKESRKFCQFVDIKNHFSVEIRV